MGDMNWLGYHKWAIEGWHMIYQNNTKTYQNNINILYQNYYAILQVFFGEFEAVT